MFPESYGAGNNDAFIIKFDSSGNSLKTITWGGGEADKAFDIALDYSGNIYITGWTRSFGVVNIAAFIAKYKPLSNGNETDDDDDDESIPGYNIAIILLCTFGIISIYLIKRRLNKY